MELVLDYQHAVLLFNKGQRQVRLYDPYACW